MGSPRIDWDMGGFREVRSRPETQAAVAALAAQVASSAGDGYETRPVEVSGGRGRAREAVLTATYAARKNEARNHTLAGMASGSRG